jgi:hypothetical protein
VESADGYERVFAHCEALVMGRYFDPEAVVLWGKAFAGKMLSTTWTHFKSQHRHNESSPSRIEYAIPR